MKPLLAFVLMLTLLSPAKAQLPVDPRVARSVTDEFIAYPLRLGYSSRFYRGDQNSLSLEPAVLVISCERIKQSLWRLLEINTPARGKIFLHLRPARNALEQATIVVEQGLTGWEYHIDVPDSLSPVAFFHAIIHASLLEIANR
ncbi:MAG TPA: hypothetical protein VK327_01505, partial [Candidatus Paceibacterota bacterium]|nr:hypothetical protein [Candidatus Paceibacterota bacterium]